MSSKYLQSASVSIIGNTGNDIGNSDPTGRGTLVLNSQAALDGAASTIGAVMTARANAIRTILNVNLNIDNRRLDTGQGINGPSPQSRTVDITVNGLNL